MSEIKKLIESLCPEGVEWEKLVDNVDVLYGYPFDSRLFCEDETFMPLIRIRDVKPAKASTYYSGEVIEEYRITKGDILVGMDGNFNLEKWNDVDGLLNQRVCKLSSKNEDKILNGFIYHYLKPVFKYIEGELNSGTVIHLSAKRINKIEIPVPPIEVQSKIVEILDNFTELEAQLEAELEARKKQYEYYRNQLLTFDEDSNVKWKEYTLGDLFVFKNGLNASKEKFGHGSPIVNYVNVYKKNYITSSDLLGKVELESSSIDRYRVKKGDVFFTRTSETKEEVGIASVLLEEVEDCVFSGFVLRARPITNVLIPEFCKYCFSTYNIRKQIIQSSTLTTRALTNGTTLSKVRVNIPPLSEQQRIVSILDRFEALTTDLQSGLPAEIEARRKQYEYYREQLLTFKRKTA